MNRTLSEIAAVLGSRVSAGDGQVLIKRVVIDSRVATAGSLFRFKGRIMMDMILWEMFSRGGAAVVSRPIREGPTIEVRDCLEALQALAAYHRRQYEIPVIAVTGNVGKTTTKDLLAACLDSRQTLKLR